MFTLRKKILVVDDEQQILDYMAKILKREGYSVITTTKGKDAIRLLKKTKPNLVILDLFLKDIDGEEIARTIRETFLNTKIPIVFLSGMITKKELYQEKIGEGILLTKPVTAKELLKVVRCALFGKDEKE